MSRIVTWGAGALGAVALCLVAVGGGAYALTERRLAARFDVPTAHLTVPTDAAALAHGRHVAVTRGCVGCHGENLAGETVIDAPPVGRITGSNLTSGAGGVGSQLTAADWDRAVRHGVRRDGSPLMIMPSQEFAGLGDEDLAAVVAYARSLPPVDRVTPPQKLGPVAYLLTAAGKIDLVPAELIDHDAARPAPPARGPTREYGAYLATGCIGCHGPGFSGGRIPGTPPEWPAAANITPDAATGIGRWTAAEFTRALRTGRRPDGRVLDDHMPWRLYAQFTDDEVAALWAYLRTLPARPAGSR